MKILFISKRGRGLPVAYRMQQEGNDVQVLVKDARSQPLWSGILEHVDSLEAGLADPPALVVFDEPGAGRKADELRSRGLPVFGSSRKIDTLLSRPLQIEPLQKQSATQLRVAPSVSFNSLDAVKDYIKSNPAAYTLRSDSFTYTANTAEEMLYMLGYIRGSLSENPEITLERKLYGRCVKIISIVVDGIIANPSYVAIEEDKPFAGARLPENLASFGQASFEGVPIVTEVNQYVSLVLKDSGYSGFVKTEAVIGDGTTIAAIAASLVENAFLGILDNINGKVGEHLISAANGSLKEMEVKTGVWYGALALRVPGRDKDHPIDSGLPIYGVRRVDLPHVWMNDMMLNTAEEPVTVGTNTTTLVVTGSGESPFIVDAAVRGIISNIKVPNAEYSTQALQIIEEGFSAVREWVTPPQVLAMQHPLPPLRWTGPTPDPVVVNVSETSPPPQVTDDNSGVM